MLRDDIITILHDRMFYSEAEMFADRIMELPEIKQMRKALELIWAYSLDPELEWKEAMENIERTVRQALKEGDK